MSERQIYFECRYCGARQALEITRVGDRDRVWLCEHCKRVWKEGGGEQ